LRDGVKGKRYVDPFNARLRDELLDGEIFYSLRDAEVVNESWRRQLQQRTLARSASGRQRRRWCCPLSPLGLRRCASRPRQPHEPRRPGRR
jgi:hypothetical protein